jgi:hypothetical protein
MPGALIEPLFITDPSEGSLAVSASDQQVMARGLALAVEQYFGPPSKEQVKKEKGIRSPNPRRELHEPQELSRVDPEHGANPRQSSQGAQVVFSAMSMQTAGRSNEAQATAGPAVDRSSGAIGSPTDRA